ncbi:MAG TPA: SRPBCC family protein [Gammaproteobacteria bacterium]
MVSKIAENGHELVLDLILDAPREKLWRCWTDTALLKQWFVPRPWTIASVEMDLRAGGSSLVVMRDPDGNEYPNPGIFLEVVPNEKLVMTDAYTSAWVPSQKPFMTAIVTFEDAGSGKTKYVARARHWTAADREQHEKMGFHEGWGQTARQLEALAQTL